MYLLAQQAALIAKAVQMGYVGERGPAHAAHRAGIKKSLDRVVDAALEGHTNVEVFNFGLALNQELFANAMASLGFSVKNLTKPGEEKILNGVRFVLSWE